MCTTALMPDFFATPRIVISPQKSTYLVETPRKKTFPGFINPAGSSAPFTRRIISSSTPPRHSASSLAFNCPTPCSAEKLPSNPRATLLTASINAPLHATNAAACPTGSTRLKWMLPSPAWPKSTTRTSGRMARHAAVAAATKSGMRAIGTEMSFFTLAPARACASACPCKCAAIAAVRACEADRYLVRSAATGVSQVIEPTGRVAAEAGLFTPAVVWGRVESRATTTPYVRWGDWFVGFCALLVVGVSLLPEPRGQEHKMAHTSEEAWAEVTAEAGGT